MIFCKKILKSEYEKGTPVTVYYVKETESTENINIKPISAYNDTTSISINDVNNISPSKIEVGYKKLNKWKLYIIIFTYDVYG